MTADFHDCVSYYAFQHPVLLPCRHTVDVSTLVQIDRCPLDRAPFSHRLVKTDRLMNQNLKTIRQLNGTFKELPVTSQITFHFYNFKLRFIERNNSHLSLTEKEWSTTERMFAWMNKQSSEAVQTTLKTHAVVKCVLGWDGSSYTLGLFTESDEIETYQHHLLISENWAQNFAGKYFGSLKSSSEKDQ